MLLLRTSKTKHKDREQAFSKNLLNNPIEAGFISFFFFLASDDTATKITQNNVLIISNIQA